jgi:hypothetical protein
MKVFGPFYPPALQPTVNHAERFCSLLEGYEVSAPSREEGFLAWLSGRAGEVARVVESAIADWKGGGSPEAAATRIEEYLRGLHEALVHHNVVTDQTGLPACCVAAMNTTMRATPFEMPTTEEAPVQEATPARSGTVVESIDGVLLDHWLKDSGAR